MVSRVKTAMAGPLPAAVAKMKLYMVSLAQAHKLQLIIGTTSVSAVLL